MPFGPGSVPQDNCALDGGPPDRSEVTGGWSSSRNGEAVTNLKTMHPDFNRHPFIPWNGDTTSACGCVSGHGRESLRYSCPRCGGSLSEGLTR